MELPTVLKEVVLDLIKDPNFITKGGVYEVRQSYPVSFAVVGYYMGLDNNEEDEMNPSLVFTGPDVSGRSSHIKVPLIHFHNYIIMKVVNK